MITKEESKVLKKLIGFPHISKVIEHLRETGITNRYGKGFSSTYISTVFNGHLEDQKVEQAIWDLSLIEKKKREEAERIREQIMSSQTLEENE